MTVIEHIFAEYVDCIRHSDGAKSEYDALLKDYANTADSLIETLSPEQKSAALRLESQRNMIAAMDEELMFCHGFRIGAQLMLEILPPFDSKSNSNN